MIRPYESPAAEILLVYVENNILSGGTEDVTSGGSSLNDEDFE